MKVEKGVAFGGTGEISPQLTGRIYVRVAVVASDPGLPVCPGIAWPSFYRGAVGAPPRPQES